MVAVDPELLIPLQTGITIFFIIIFAILKKFSIKDRNWFMLGMFFGGLIYSMLIMGSTIKESLTLSEYFLKFFLILAGATYYIAAVLFSAVISLVIFLKKETKERINIIIFKGKGRRGLYVLTGMSLIFSICGVYFGLRCLETIPFLENIVSNSPCS